jgi:hypothetical protein
MLISTFFGRLDTATARDKTEKPSPQRPVFLDKLSWEGFLNFDMLHSKAVHFASC